MHGLPISWHFSILLALKLLKTFGLIPGAMAGYWMRKIFQKWRQERAMAGWPTTEARILWGTVEREGRRIWVEFTFSYFVGEYRSGKYVRTFRKEEDADEFVRYVKDRHIQIRYKASDPDDSTILDRDLEMIAPLTISTH